MPGVVVQERYERLIALQDERSWTGAKEQIGREVEVLVNATDGRKDRVTGRVSGRARDGRLVHVSGSGAPGDVLTSRVTQAAPYHLIADAGVTTHRPWRARATTPAPGPSLLSIGPRPTD